jgi:hypothetical protein
MRLSAMAENTCWRWVFDPSLATVYRAVPNWSRSNHRDQHSVQKGVSQAMTWTSRAARALAAALAELATHTSGLPRLSPSHVPGTADPYAFLTAETVQHELRVTPRRQQVAEYHHKTRSATPSAWPSGRTVASTNCDPSGSVGPSDLRATSAIPVEPADSAPCSASEPLIATPP